MSKFKIVNLIDKVFITVAVFLIIYAWINFYIRDLWTTFILSLVFTFAIVFLIYFFINKKEEKSTLTRDQQKQIEENFLAFKLSSKEEKMNLVNEILKKNYITILRKNSLCYIKEDKKILVIFATHLAPLTQADIINLLDEFYNQKVDGFDIVCSSTKGSINLNIFNDKKINIITKQKLYEEFFNNNIFPDKSCINFNLNKVTLKQVLLSLFEQKKAKHYFLYGLLLILSSIILPYQSYYIVIGSMLLMFSIICKILPKFTN